MVAAIASGGLRNRDLDHGDSTQNRPVWPRSGMNGWGLAWENTRAVAPFRNHVLSLLETMSRTKTEPITPPNCNASRRGTGRQCWP